ncbi:MAG: hydrogenase maturation factor [Lachnospiraceae bacterium]|nr:hydrogenase maturation factor [Lachnospiraceae bacterium]
MKTGKISEPILKRSVLKKISYKSKSVLSRAAVGHDSAVVAVGEKRMVTATETVVAKVNLLQCRPFIKAVNNLAAVGATPQYAQISIVLPEGMREIKLKMIMDEMADYAAKSQVHITGGSTSVSDAVINPVVTVTVTGFMDNDSDCKYKYKEEIKPGYDIVMTKAAALEGTAILAMEHQEEFEKRFTSLYINNASAFINDISIVNEAAVAIKHGVAAMHDMSEGGVFGAIWELCEAGNCGAEINLKKINMRQETIELTNYLNINPYLMPSAGSLLMVTKDGLGLINEMEKNGIDAYVIGKITEGNDRVVVNDEEKRFLEPPKNK